MARKNEPMPPRLDRPKLAELQEAIDGLILLGRWQQELLGRARALLPKAAARKVARPRQDRLPHR